MSEYWLELLEYKANFTYVNKCTKRYPRQLLRDTETGDDGYPLYRRRNTEDGGVKTKLKMKINNSMSSIAIQ